MRKMMTVLKNTLKRSKIRRVKNRVRQKTKTDLKRVSITTIQAMGIRTTKSRPELSTQTNQRNTIEQVETHNQKRIVGLWVSLAHKG